MTLVYILVIVVILFLTIIVTNSAIIKNWQNLPHPPGKLIELEEVDFHSNFDGSRKHRSRQKITRQRRTRQYSFYYNLKGSGTPTVVIETALGTPSAEWWPIQYELSKSTGVFTYDRAGYGLSDFIPKPRTSRQIALELDDLLTAIEIKPPYILVGHSLGGLYINHFARLFPEKVAGAIFLDPLSPNDVRFKNELNPEIYKKSGVDKSQGIKIYSLLGKSGLLRFLKPLIIKSPPFFYYKNFPEEIIGIIWNHMLQPKVYNTVLDEYRQTHVIKNIQDLELSGRFPEVPIKVIYHSSQIVINEIVKYGGLQPDEAELVEKLWEELIKEYLTLSKDSEWEVAEKSSHFIHLDQPELVIKAILDLLSKVK